MTETPTPQPLPTIAPTPTVTPTPLPVVRIHAGDQALLEGRWDTAIEEFQTANNTSPDSEVDSAALLGTGRTQLLSGNPLEAARIFQKLIDEYPQSSQLSTAYFLMAQAYSDLDRYAEAAQAYSSYAALRPGLIDGYVQDLRGDALFAAADYASAIPAYQAAIQSPGLIDTIGIEMKMARAVALSGDYIKALELYEDILARSSDDSTKALIDLRKGQIYTALGETDLATSVYLDAVNNYPTSYDSYSALLALVEAGIPVNELNRGLVDYYAGQYGVAIAAFDRYLQSSPDDPGTARYYMGLAMRDSGSYESAINEWDKIIQQNPDHRFWDEAWEQKAYTQWFYLDQYTQAIQTLLDFVNLAPTHPRTAEFLFDAAIVAERDDQLDQAAELWERVANLFPDYENSSRALFLSGISNYRLDDYNAASATFQRLLGIAVTPEDRARALLWLGKTQSKLGDLAGAHTYWGQAAEQDPTGYYSERARDLLFDRKPFWPPQSYNMAIDWEGEKHIAEDWLRQTFSLPSETVLDGLGSLASAQEMIRGAELWKLGLYSEARNEFEQLRKAVSSDPVQLYQLANYLAELGLYRSATLAARQVLDLAGLDDAGTLNAPVYFNRLRFGTYYSDLIVPAAQAAQFHPLFIFSLIRQESLFESFVRSSAAASGLMQIIPSTGADIASRLGWPANYTDKDLLRPVVNVTFGVDYLNRQRELFDGDIYAALAAYNGGPGNAMAWYEQAKGDPDLFLEIVRFSETRDYIRRIYEIFNLYRRIYSITP